MIEDTRRPRASIPVGPGIDAEIEDEALATAARARYRHDGIIDIEPDHGIRSALWVDEQLLAVRQTASVECLSAGSRTRLAGRLAITTRRLMLVDAEATTLASLEELDDVTLLSDRLLVLLTGGTGLTINVARPRLLRVELAEARAGRLDRQMAASSNVALDSPRDLPRW